MNIRDVATSDLDEVDGQEAAVNSTTPGRAPAEPPAALWPMAAPPGIRHFSATAPRSPRPSATATGRACHPCSRIIRAFKLGVPYFNTAADAFGVFATTKGWRLKGAAADRQDAELTISGSGCRIAATAWRGRALLRRPAVWSRSRWCRGAARTSLSSTLSRADYQHFSTPARVHGTKLKASGSGCHAEAVVPDLAGWPVRGRFRPSPGRPDHLAGGIKGVPFRRRRAGIQ